MDVEVITSFSPILTDIAGSVSFIISLRVMNEDEPGGPDGFCTILNESHVGLNNSLRYHQTIKLILLNYGFQMNMDKKINFSPFVYCFFLVYFLRFITDFF